jgi:CHAD domain-containing protein
MAGNPSAPGKKSGNPLIDHYKQREDLFHEHLYKTLTAPAKEDIHQLRTNTKKLRALWSLISSLDKDKARKTALSNLVDPVFSHAGTVREIQLNQEMSEKYRAQYLETYRSFLKAELKRSKRTMLAALKAFDMQRFNELSTAFIHLVDQIPTSAIETELARRIIHHADSVWQLKRALPHRKKLHKIRIHLKALKELLLVARMLSKKLMVKPLLDQLKKLEDRIGDWHDKVVLARSMEYYVQEKAPRNKKRIEALIHRYREKELQQQKKIKRLLDRRLTPGHFTPLKKLAIGKKL